MFEWRFVSAYIYTPLGSLVIEEKIDWRWDGIAQLFGKYNWYTFTLANIHCEYEPYGPLYSVNIQLLGFGFYLGINPPWETPESIHLNERCKEAFKMRDDLDGKNEPEGWTPDFD